ncbi:HpcH/HpaI aldolase/citrate lyase family protein [Desulfofustis glycolicus]|uniref:Citrate lyase subunit beta / citryl-CoA lyase n=1 Tax=Desulfofustis glycolicus DSM 9705 TaxID=1121409 RepID=A0A1M5T731_9BACT|nr:CoA ester lyase [Desulfofustis glycolicus]MCB2215382.1 CoA ester lyase [Desulfobulbaceae bacterium]SHH46193.1 citrate lyase subunit beta / citryl-CoA lyase [Desulfofustis glycolicus DSM 9705]
MAVMRSVFYVPSNNEKMVGKAPTIGSDIVTLDLEDSVPPAEKAKGREMIQKYLKTERANQAAPYLYVRINNWETEMTNDDLEAIVHPGLDGVCLAKCGSPENVQRLDWKLEELEQRRGMKVGTVAIQLLIETAKGVINAYPSAAASPRVNSLIFGAVDYTKDMRVELTSEGVEQLYARYHTAVAARAAGCVAIDCPFVAFKDEEAFKKSTKEGHQMGYEGRMLIHPSQIERSHEIYTPSPESVEWAEGVKKVFEEEGIAKGSAAVTYLGKMVDTPVYENAMQILRTMAEIKAVEDKNKK